MDAINKNVRNASISRFAGVYAISIIGVVVAAYFIFNAPGNMYKQKVNSYQSSEDEQKKLLGKINDATLNLNGLVQTDRNYLNTTNEIEKGNLQTQIGEFQKQISNVLSDIQNDSNGFNSPISRRNSYNYLTAFTTILSYRNTISQLQSTLLSKGGDANELVKVQAALQACNTQLEIEKLAVAAANKPPPPNPSGGGTSNNAKETQLQAQLQKAQDDLEACKKDKANLQAAQPGNKSIMTDAQKAAVLFDAASDLYNLAESSKNLIEKRGILSSARQLFDKSSHDYPDGDKVNKMIKQIDGELKKLKNLG